MSHLSKQFAFANHIRDPETFPAPEDVEDRRMNIYRELFFNNVSGFVTNGFPVLCSLYDDSTWQQLCRAFLAKHACRSPYFVDISKEFVEFIANEYALQPSDPPFMAELAHYEWVELALSTAKGQSAGDWAGQPYSAVKLSELAWVLSYEYPVHQISTEFQPETPSGPHYYVVFRDKEDDVHFLNIDQVNAFVLSCVEDDAEEVSALIEKLQNAMPHLPADQVAAGCRQALDKFVGKGILVPT
ncbi:DUF2063 domain-containing protein [Bowmanella yangjiangensis]|uniref:DNA-binding domain-containing protein n=1 Tax=Bowmanella yangjiangensis TaxID=2811230 RepID=A0ABS3CUU6_9ALTE|nr:putative DNA-binding domain-containing protein [Bowmanella yangjiangensis]MBN7820898.1 putative DNA-binding domain-containing protein [Bowmanella yangjiangensis]